ncbi:MAG: bifunctional 3,4-dihydroxy-2-butanone-4-phosphate synthase/GTP cyclohydrolase II [Planctomycetes bacterium]|jgi:3,4-dihydroxy 2-butanone 4-phosphate synthase/GTP cyclohydrolase II|nr:bifunctional 3,4-dihydroxy-2-butanone-4-phosphate synthase/GTP cyclohydrolase II [Planctomycetota bacterium]MBT4029060.1 bifunctional 3,4-dihydroxy-2-butanone-4-phosphate synthase/GTP cyclohydrolase II [Planctomycetota bacterium]MBT4560320.1 bifunctional 3,4-dihydroxy-2-butanone-4-phosphate synthase/GTP cyclohydrolase II [Planctomycetota bacterium]MBT5101769.1 bifunctional 3,4-dihydroxy-2-butanone-4-phosphate synthase/GTP cyclohydrolase II [Planctomycetota bacterium]MBT5121033.1 bifunctional
MNFATIDESVQAIAEGRMVILVDDPKRENEGDLVIAAEKCTPEIINFMRKEAGGLICLALDGAICDQLGLRAQVADNTSSMGTAFLESIEARQGVTTGISAADRSHTILTALKPDAVPEDLARPGHMFPLRARKGGVLVRPGQTEGSVDLARLAGLRAGGVICEIMNDDGTMARMPELEVFAKKYDMPIVTVEALIEYRRRRERLIDRRVQGVRMPTRYGDFTAHLYTALNDDKEHVALTFGWSDAPDGDNVPFEKLEESVTVRVHSECLTGDVLGSARCDCGQQLDAAMQQIASDGKGVLLYIRQEGRGIGLEAKLRAYQLQDQGFDTVEANEKLGYPADMRNYGTGAQILSDLGVRRMRLLTNNPKKLTGLAGYGLEITEQVSLQVEAGEHNCTYLRTKRDKMGHILPHLEH